MLLFLTHNAATMSSTTALPTAHCERMCPHGSGSVRHPLYPTQARLHSLHVTAENISTGPEASAGGFSMARSARTVS